MFYQLEVVAPEHGQFKVAQNYSYYLVLDQMLMLNNSCYFQITVNLIC